MSSYEFLFSPLRLKSGLELPNRIVMPAMHLNLTPTGEVNDEMIAFYRLRARGGAGLIIAGGCTVSKDAGGEFMIGVNEDRFIPGLSKLASAIQDEGSKAAIQLYHAGRYTYSMLLYGKQAPSASATYSPLTKEMSREMSKEEIEETIHEFYLAAERVKKAGFDAVEMLASAGYLVSQFLSPLTNHRNDEYGGTLKNRMRFGIEVLEAIKKGADGLPVMIRLSGYDFVHGSTPQMEIVEFARVLVEHGAELINTTGGWHESRVPQITYHLPEAGMKHLSVLLKNALPEDVPVSIANRIHTPQLAEALIRRGVCDAVALGRPFITDWQWGMKAKAGREDEILQCISCNQKCLDNVFNLKPVGCAVNPLAGKPFEGEFLDQRTSNPKKIMVVGGGPAGMAAAWLLAETGHEVELYERNAHLGGEVHYFANIPHKESFLNFIDPMTRLIEAAGGKIFTGMQVDAALIESKKPDLVVLATGAKPAYPPIDGIDLPHVMSAHQLIHTDARVGKNVVIIGGGPVGVEAALMLAMRSAMSPESVYHFMLFDAYEPQELGRLMLKSRHNITIVEMLRKIGKGIGKSTKWVDLLLLGKFGVKSLTLAKVVRITKEYVEVEHDGATKQIPADTVVVAAGIKPDTSLADSIASLGVQVETIGDASGGGDIGSATEQALELARKLL